MPPGSAKPAVPDAARAISASATSISGAARTRTSPSTSSRSSAAASRRWDAMASAFPRTASAARWADEPASTAWRLLKPPMPSAMAPVSPVVTAIRAGSARRISATTCASIDFVPCPIAVAPEATCTLPDAPMRTRALSNGPAPSALDEIREPDADEAPVRPRASWRAGNSRPARLRQRQLLNLRVIAAVEHDGVAAARDERLRARHALRPDEIASAQLGAVDAELRARRGRGAAPSRTRPAAGPRRALASLAPCW